MNFKTISLFILNELKTRKYFSERTCCIHLLFEYRTQPEVQWYEKTHQPYLTQARCISVQNGL